MRFARWGFLLAGLALLGVIVAETDFREALRLVGQMGPGLVLVFALFILGFAGDVATSLLTLRVMPFRLAWYGRLWLVRMLGEAFNYTLPAGGMGGEPVKALLLNRHFGVPFRDGAASLFLTKTVNVIALVAFLAIGFALMQANEKMSEEYRLVASIGLAALTLGIAAFFMVQRFRVTSALARRIPAWAGGGVRLAALTAVLHDVETRFVEFYASGHGRLPSALLIGFCVWMTGAAEIYVTLAWLGHPVTWQEAWIIEAAAQLVRAGTFFIPASIGAQEGIFLLICTAVTGSPTVGIAVAVVRRLRDIVWFGLGFTVGPVLAKLERRIGGPAG